MNSKCTSKKMKSNSSLKKKLKKKKLESFIKMKRYEHNEE